MKLLYLSCHSIAEYDEVRLFKELGIDVFSHGAYTDPNVADDPKRPPIGGVRDDRLIALAKENQKENMSREFLNEFDVILSHWMPQWIAANWERMSDKIVILRTNGQSSPDDEHLIELYRKAGLKIVRYSPMERKIPGYVGEDAMIRFYKDPNEWMGWNGNIAQVMTIGQSMIKRAEACNWNVFNQATAGYPRKLYGPENEEASDIWAGLVSYNELRQALRDSRCYFYTGTKPASYTLNFMEAWMTGIPIVSIGPEFGNPEFIESQKTFEIHKLIKNGVDGFVADNIGKLNSYVGQLLNDEKLARKIGKKGRQKAKEIFGKQTIKKQWSDFFGKLK